MSRSKQTRIARLKQLNLSAQKRFDAQTHRILDDGEYNFEVVESRFDHDSVRRYGYLYVQLRCNESILTSDRFPDTDNMLWKLASFLASVGIDPENWKSEKQLIGLKGRLIASAKGEQRIYTYQPAEVATC